MLIYRGKLWVINARLTTPSFWFTFLCTSNIGFCTLLLSTSMSSSMESEFKMQMLWNIQHATTIFNAVSTSAVTKYWSLLNLPFKRPKDLSIVTLFADSRRLWFFYLNQFPKDPSFLVFSHHGSCLESQQIYA